MRTTRRSRQSAARLVLPLAVCAVVGVFGGCAQTAQHQDVLSDPSPQEVGSTTRTVDIQNTMAYTVDTNLRLIQSDMGRFWLMDRPSRLTPLPMR
ncbi:MAG: hypothetical protein MUE97_02825 [Phycisphaerales bacterium]|nr:hypothetical protein [Phycisphaerales bacterium]